ncbi:hypothetical protein ATKI12_6893 [Kitasatospora sp. Ki12]
MTYSAITLLLLGLPALTLGVLWATDFRGIATRFTARQAADRANLPSHVRRLSPAPTPGRVQSVLGVLLAVTGCIFIGTGCWTLLP